MKEYLNYVPFLKVTEDYEYIKGYSIDWRFVDMETVSANELNSLLDILEQYGIQKIELESMGRFSQYDRLRNRYHMEVQKNYVTIRWLEVWWNGELWVECPHQVSTNPANMQDGEDEKKIKGNDAFKRITKMFRRIYHKELLDCFGLPFESQREKRRLKERIKQCVPPPTNYAYKSTEIVDNFWKIDISSAYPFEYSKRLPTMNGAKIVSGRVEPTKEFPFAFYLNSHHIKILGELDTRDLYKYREFYEGYSRQYVRVPDDREETLLCPVCEYSLEPIFAQLYKDRNTHPEIKKYMNYFNGFLYMGKRLLLPHLPAVVQARTIFSVIKKAMEIESAGNLVRFIATDSVGWEGEYIPEYDKKRKVMGGFYYEYKHCKAIVMGPKRYQILTEEGYCKTVWAGVPTEKQAMMVFGDIVTSKERPKIIVLEEDGRLHERDCPEDW